MTHWPKDPETRLRLEQEIRSLTGELAGLHDAATVRRHVEQAVESLPDPRFPLFLPTFARRLARDLLLSTARWEGRLPSTRPQVLFVCVHNAGRSQMAAAFTRQLSRGQVDVLSAGSAPVDAIHDNVHAAMKEVGIDLAEEFPKRLSDAFVRASDVVVTMGCGDACPVYPGKRYEDWPVDDPAGQGLPAVRAVRDAVRARVERLLADLGVATGEPPPRARS
jgi:protein-tyrosine-phosphatase